MTRQGVAERWSATWPMLGLCLLAGSRWLLEAAHPDAQSSAVTQFAGCWMAAGVLAMRTTWRRPPARFKGGDGPGRSSSVGLPACFAGAAALAGPTVAATISPRTVHSGDATIALALTPCVIAVAAAAAFANAGENEMTGRLWPGLAGVAGLLLLLPQPRIADWRLGVALAAMPLFAGTGAVLFVAHTVQDETLTKTAVSVYKSAFTLGIAGLAYAMLVPHNSGALRGPFSWSAAGLDGLMALLSLLALQRHGPVRWAAQFLLAPLLTVVEGIVFLRPVLDARSWLALVLLGISSVYLFVVGRIAPDRLNPQSAS